MMILIQATLFQINQGALVALGVSHPALSTVVDVSSECGFASKLTGAGGGGCAITLLPADSHNHSENITKLKEMLRLVAFRL